MATEVEIKLLQEFERDFPSETACIEFLRDQFAKLGLLICHECQSVEVEHLTLRTVHCLNCGNESWFTAKTFFERTRKFKPLFALIWFQEHGLPLSSSNAHNLLGIAQSSAWLMCKKIQMVHWNELESNQEQTIVFPCEAFIAAIKKRSRETPPREHPQAEIPSMRRTRETLPSAFPELSSAEPAQPACPLEPGSNVASSIESLPLEQQRILEVLVQARGPIHFDLLNELTQLPLNELSLHLTYLSFDKLITREFGDRYSVDHRQLAYLIAQSNSANADIPDVEMIATQFITFTKRCFDGVSRKYLQLYASQFSNASTKIRKAWTAVMRTFVKQPYMRAHEVYSFVSPAQILLAMSEHAPRVVA